MDKMKYEREYSEINVVFILLGGQAGERTGLQTRICTALCAGGCEAGSRPGFGTWPSGFAAEVSRALQASRGHSRCSLEAQAWQDPPSSSELQPGAAPTQQFLLGGKSSIAKPPPEAETLPWLCPSHLAPG